MDTKPVADYFKGLQAHIEQAFLSYESEASFTQDLWQNPQGGGGDSRVLSDGQVWERAGVNFSQVQGATLPDLASEKRPELAGARFEAMGLSLVTHPRNPYAPTSHCNLRYLIAHPKDGAPIWWFGGGFDLTPCYGFDDDCRHWHRTAQAACAPFGEQCYPEYKAWCDRYFYLPHRGETRGVGGLFFDDLNTWEFERCFAFVQQIGDRYLDAYLPIIDRRHGQDYGTRERDWQLYRRGRYVEFNLVYDRGTQFGLRMGGRTESILMSLPPLARWQYNYQPAPQSAEAQLQGYLKPRDWVGGLSD